MCRVTPNMALFASTFDYGGDRLVPSRNPRKRPALDVARPDAFRPGSTTVPEMPEPWLIEFGDGTERPVAVEARSDSTDGREIIHALWHIDGGTWTETYYADHAKMRKNW